MKATRGGVAGARTAAKKRSSTGSGSERQTGSPAAAALGADSGSKVTIRSNCPPSACASSDSRKSWSGCAPPPRGSGSVLKPSVIAPSPSSSPGARISGRKTTTTSGARASSRARRPAPSRPPRWSRKCGSSPPAGSCGTVEVKYIAWPTKATRTARPVASAQALARGAEGGAGRPAHAGQPRRLQLAPHDLCGPVRLVLLDALELTGQDEVVVAVDRHGRHRVGHEPHRPAGGLGRVLGEDRLESRGGPAGGGVPVGPARAGRPRPGAQLAQPGAVAVEVVEPAR